MNIFNRVLVILGLLVTMVLSAVVFVASGPVIQTLLVFLQRMESNLSAMSGPRALVRLGGGLLITLVIWVICAALLYLEFKRSKVKTIKVQQVSGGDAELTADSIGSRLEYNIDLLQDVVRVKPTVKNARRGVRVVLEVETSPEIDVPAKTEEIQALAKDIVENRMGLRLDMVRVVMRHAPYPKKGLFGGRKAEPAAPTAAVQQPVEEPEQPSAVLEEEPALAPADDWLSLPAEEAVVSEVEDTAAAEGSVTDSWLDAEQEPEED